MATKKSSFSLRRPFWSLSGLLDQIFFLLAGAASFWLAWLVWRERALFFAKPDKAA